MPLALSFSARLSMPVENTLNHPRMRRTRGSAADSEVVQSSAREMKIMAQIVLGLRRKHWNAYIRHGLAAERAESLAKSRHHSAHPKLAGGTFPARCGH